MADCCYVSMYVHCRITYFTFPKKKNQFRTKGPQNKQAQTIWITQYELHLHHSAQQNKLFKICITFGQKTFELVSF